MIIYLDIHGLCRMIVSGRGWLMGPVAHEFAGHRSEAFPEDRADAIIDLDHADSSGGDTFFFDDNFRGARWRISLAGLDGPRLRLGFRGNALCRMIVSKWIVEPALRFVIEQKGGAMVHSTALTDGSSAVVLAAAATVGKTSMMLDWLDLGHPFLSDDFSILLPGRVLGYFTPLRIGMRHLLENHALHGLPVSDMTKIALRTALRYALLGYARMMYKPHVQRIIPSVKLTNEARLKGLIFLRRGPGPGRIQESSPLEIVPDLVAVDRKEMRSFTKYMSAGRERRPDSLAARFFEKHDEHLRNIIGDLPCRIIELGDEGQDRAFALVRGEVERLMAR